ncbi:ammonium transporter [Actimicrobium sp. CCC2.4]|uniref:ammonium transporter n=1 Tax=Actimicrobium sp. CCC2.4 TaxID=3048606 RepID=UPI002AC9AF7E|nr:ammonium transporter [Actimicrobium sp. CCC2.4]MEB0136976.1 ammonium transporter [Actimicrobium sp. CCC2.4]WPX32748.1 ammonium transporter [Actimicrobium sp. CCC2.4]
MKKQFASFLAAGALLLAVGFAPAAVAADEVAPAKVEAAVVAAPAADAPAPVAATAAAPAAGELAVPAAPAAAAPVPNKGDTAWMMVATCLVILMTIPGLALFYGGLVRSKNMLSILMQVFTIFAVIIVLWCIYGYSLAFTEGGAFIGKFDRLFLNGIFDPVKGTFATAATFSKGVVIPEFIFVVFQATFAAITCGLIIGAFAERAKFAAVLMFIVIWFTFSYLPVAHMVWFWPGPDGIKDAASLASESAKAGWLWQKGALDFAGGTVVHINAAVAGLVGAYVIGKRVGYGKESMAPHSLTMTMIGASLLWVGWFGFNAGSALEANDIAVLAFVNTLLATAAAAASWIFAEWLTKGKPSMLGGASGAVAGLVAITPACGFVGPMGALAIGLLSGVICLWGVSGLKRLLGADDSLDVFGVHGVGGILGALLTGVFAAPSLGGQGIYDYVANKMSPDYSIASQVWIQAQGVITTVIWSAVVSLIAYKLVDMIIGMRVVEEDEREGLDISSHGESAYHS